MKLIRILLTVFSIIFLLAACNNASDSKKNDTGDTVQAEGNASEDDTTASEDDDEGADEEDTNSAVERDEAAHNQSADSHDDKASVSKRDSNGKTGGTKQQPSKVANKQSEERNTDSEPLTKKQAEELVRRHLELDSRPEVKVQYDHDEDGRYVIHVFEIVDQGESSHSATLGWYYVDPKTGKIESMF